MCWNRFESPCERAAERGGCRWDPNTQSEVQALCLRQPARLRVPLLLPPGYHLGQYAQVSKRTHTHTHTQIYSCVGTFTISHILANNASHSTKVNVHLTRYLQDKQAIILYKSKYQGPKSDLFLYRVAPSLYSKTTVYGLGSALSRRRRSTGRCSCAKPDDQSCTSFCRHR